MPIIVNKNVKILWGHTLVAVMKDLNLVQMRRAAMVCYLFLLSKFLPVLIIILLLSPVLTTCSTHNNCSHICAIVNGMPTCFCHFGYELAVGDSDQCIGKLVFIKYKLWWLFLGQNYINFPLLFTFYYKVHTH